MPPALIPAFCKGTELQRQIRDAKRKARKEVFDLWWLGQSGFLLQWNGRCVLFDPYLSDSLTEKYASTPKPHVRMSELVIRPELLNEIDMVTSSHNHTDHLDAGTLKPLLKINPAIRFIIPEANRLFVSERVGCDPSFPVGLNDGESIEIEGFTFHGVPAAHNTIERDNKGRCKFMGYVVRFGEWSIYHSGDTIWYDGMAEILQRFHLDIALLPINGNDPERGVAGNLNGEEAVRLGKQTGARLVIPHHYDMFYFNTADPADFAATAARLHQPYRVLKLGEQLNWG